MAQLDRLIGALAKHQAEALILQEGRQPALLLDGSQRPIASTRLDAAMLSRLLEEIVPGLQREAFTQGEAVCFTYASDAATVSVESAAATGAIIRICDSATATTPPGSEAGSTPAGSVAGTAPPRGVEAVQVAAPQMDILFRLMVERGASDLHLSSCVRPMLRIDGEMQALGDRPVLSPEPLEGMLREITPARNWSEFAADGDTDFAYEIAGLCRFRCNLFRDRRGPGAVFRIIPARIVTADDLGLAPEIRNLTQLTKGLVLVTGPTGSGKSTTLTALVDLINHTRTDHVITIEDPIEFVHENRKSLINQREVNVHTQGFKRALRAALREDPDVVLVGEMRDLETVAIALETAETGHLVFGTLHTSSAVSTVDRLVDQFPPGQQGQIRVMLSETLRAILSQVLCRKKNGGRVAAIEVLMALPAVANLIREGKTFQIPSIMQTGRKHGMVTMNDALLDLVKRKLVEPAEAYRKCHDKTGLASAFKSNQIPVDFLAAAGPVAPV